MSLSQRKNKVVFIVTRLNIGGVASHINSLISGLKESEYKNILVSGEVGRGEEVVEISDRENLRLINIKGFRRNLNPALDLVTFYKILRIIWDERPIIVHTHTAKAGALGRLAALFAGVPIRVHTFHGHIFHSYFSRLKTRIFILVEKFLALFTSKIIVVSQQIKEDLLKYRICDNAKIEVIELGFELDDLFTLNCDRNDKNIKVGIVGRLTLVKNHKLFLNAAQLVVRISENIKFMVVGDGELRKELEDRADILNIASSVVFVGWQKDLRSIYENLDIVVLTSFNEGTPVSLIEAMAAGRPVVATKVGGIVDILLKDSSTSIKECGKILLSDRGIVVDSFDPQIFAQAIMMLVDDKDLRVRLGEGGRKFVRDRFTKERLIKNIENLYSKLILENTR